MKRLIFFSVFFIFLIAAAWGDTFTWAPSSWDNNDNWNNSDNWTGGTAGSYPGENSGRGDTAIIAGYMKIGNIQITENMTLDALYLETGNVVIDLNSFELTIGYFEINQLNFKFQNGTVTVSGTTRVNFTVSNSSVTNGELTTQNLSIGDGNIEIYNMQSGGSFTIGGGSIAVGSYVTPNVTISGVTSSIGTLDLGTLQNGNNRSLTIATATGVGSVTIAEITSAGAVTINSDTPVTVGPVNAASLTGPAGALTIDGNIVTSGNQSYTGAVTVNGTRTLASTGGVITTGAGTVTATSGVTIEAGSGAANNIVIGSGGISAATTAGGVIRLESGSGITIGGPITAYQLIVLANTTSGTVAFGSSVFNISSPTANTDGSVGDLISAPIYVRAYDFTASGSNTITPGASGQLCLELGNSSAYSSDSFDGIVAGNRYHIHGLVTVPDPTRHLVYYNGAIPTTIFTPDSEYSFIDASASSETTFSVTPNKNIYIYDVGNNGNKDLSFTVETGANRSGFIEISGTYTSTGTLTLSAGTGGVRLDGATVNLGSNDFDIGAQPLTLVGTGKANSITAAAVTLGEITGNGSSLSIIGNATLNGASNTGIAVLLVNGTSLFANPNAMTISTSGAQNYTGTVTLGRGVGTSLRTLTGSSVSMGSISGENRSLTINATATLNGGSDIGALVVNGNATFSGAMTTNIGSVSVSGTSSIGADISTTSTQIYSDTVTLSGTGATRILQGTIVTMGAITGGTNNLTVSGNTTLNGGTAIGALVVNGNSGDTAKTTTINNAITAASINIGATGATGLISINANITTTGAQTYTGAVTLGNDITFTANTGNLITFGSTVRSNNATARSITITNANARFDGDVGFVGNPISSLSVAGTSTIYASITTSGNQTYSGAITGGQIRLDAGGNITIYGAITATTNLSIKTPKATGIVTLTNTAGNITVGDIVLNPNECPEVASYPNVVMYIRANTFAATAYTGIITPGTAAPYEMCIDVNFFSPPTTFNVDGGRYHTHGFSPNANLIYGPSVPSDLLSVSPRIHINSTTSNISSFTVNSGFDIYIVNVGGSHHASTENMTFTTSGTGFIEVRGAYTSSGTLTLNAGTGGVRLDAATVNLTGAGNNFDIGTQPLTLLGSGGSNSITAAAVTMGAITGGGNSLTINGNAVFNGTANTGIEVLYVSGTSTIGGNINTDSTQTYAGLVTLSGTSATRILTGTSVTMGAITGGANSLTITGNAVFNGAANTGIATLSVSGTSAINGNITTTGAQTYTGAVALGDNINFTANAGSLIWFNTSSSTLRSNNATARSVTITNANARFDGVVGFGGNPISSLSVDGTSTIYANVTTTGTQIYTGPVTLAGTSATHTLTGTSVSMGAITGGTNNLTINGNATLNGGSAIGALVVNGNATFSAAMTTNIGSVSVSGTSTISANITTTGDQTYTGAVTLGADVNLSGTSSSNVLFSSTVNGEYGLTITTANVQFSAAVGGVTELISVNITAGTSTINANITTTGDQTYTGTVTLGGAGARTLTAGGTITTTGTVTATGAVIIKAANLLTISGGITASSNSVTLESTTGNIAISGAITAANLSILTHRTSGTVTLSGSEDITVGNTVLAPNECPKDFTDVVIYIRAKTFTASSYTGDIIPGTISQLCLDVDDFSAPTPFNLAIDRYHQHAVVPISGKHLVYGPSVPADIELLYPTTLIHHEPSTTSTDTSFKVDPNFNIYIVNVGGSHHASRHNMDFTTSGTGFIEIRGTYGSTHALELLAGSGGIRLNDATVNLSGASNKFDIGTQPLTLLGSGSSITAANVSLGAITGGGNSLTITASGNATLNGGSEIRALTIIGNAVFSAAMTTNDGHISVTGTSAIGANITTSGTQTYTGAVTLSGGARTLAGTTITLGAISGGNNNLTITGAAEFNGAVNTGIATLSVSGTSIIGGNITTTVTQTYTGAVSLTGSGATRTLEGTTVTMGAITGGGKNLTISGNAVFNGANNTGIATLSVSGTSTIDGNITTTGDQSYTGNVTLGGTGERTLSAGGNITITGTVTAAGTVNITAVSNITIGDGITAATNAVKLETTAINGSITISGAIDAANLSIITRRNSGTVTLTNTAGNITVGDNPLTPNECREKDLHPDVVIYIRANTFNADSYTGTIFPGTAAPYELCLDVNTPETLSCVDGDRYHHHIDIEPPQLRILYSFTEDFNGNGRLDRIRVQTNLVLDETIGFDVTVEGYEVINFTLGTASNNDSFYINLNEKSDFDGENTPAWQIVSLGSLALDADSLNKSFTPVDTIPPRIVYTLTLPGHPGTYLRLTESVTSAGASFTLGGTLSVTSVSPIGDLDLLLDLSSSFAINDLDGLNITNGTLANGYFSAENLTDNSKEPPRDSSDIKPKYPVDWGYTNYADDTGSNVFKPPHSLIDHTVPLDTITPSPSASVIRRVTDILVSMPPSGEDSAGYFAWPVWAKNEKGTISIFNGTAFLEEGDENIELQARINAPNLSGTLQLIYKTAERANRGELWQPFPSLYYFAPDGGSLLNATDFTPLFNFNFPAINSGSRVEFYLYTGNMYGSTPNTDQFIARLDIPNGAAIPSNWYTLVRPFSFDIQNVRTQRGGVSVLNNVINSNNRENAYIRYNLPRAGRVTIQIYTLEGNVVKSLRRNEHRDAGTWTDTWDGSNNAGRAVARGMYFVRVVGPDIDEIRKIMVIK